MTSNSKLNTWLDRPVLAFLPQVTIYHLILALILITTALSRFILLGERVMSHDEVNHVVPAYTFYQGGGYRYDPITHGPLQFHLIALSYTLFGDSDFTARIPDALFGIAVVAFALLAFKRYLGRVGALVAGLLFTISPYISYYSRYTRNEIYIVFWGMALLWGVLRYLEYGRKIHPVIRHHHHRLTLHRQSDLLYLYSRVDDFSGHHFYHPYHNQDMAI
jgi:uncharacterized protein (TIGR03663 family)